MKGDSALMLAGTDHASIATQNKVEQKLKKEERADLNSAENLFFGKP
jgi:valyl-tRNA synthetase